jgi:hypothetical protein
MARGSTGDTRASRKTGRPDRRGGAPRTQTYQGRDPRPQFHGCDGDHRQAPAHLRSEVVDDPRSDPTVIDLIELAGLWLAAGDRRALERSLGRLIDELEARFPSEAEFRQRFVELLELSATGDAEELRRRYRRATLG